jgi:hypothetical protein
MSSEDSIMNKALALTSTLLLSASVMAAGPTKKSFLEFGDEGYETNQSKWSLNVGVDYMQYPTSLPSFKGVHQTVKDDTQMDTYGLNLNFGREMQIGGGLSTTLRIGGFYHNTFNTDVGKASKDIDIDLANTKTNHLVYGGEVGLSLNYMIETSVVNIQPFIEGAVGTGQAQVTKEYLFKGLTVADSDDEYYDMKSNENFAFNKIGLGVNFISSYGFTSFVKVSRTGLGISERKLKGKTKQTDSSTINNINSNEKNLQEEFEVLAASVGIGFLF